MNVLHVADVYEPTDHELLIATIIEEGNFNDDGGEPGNRDWPVTDEE